MEFSHQQELRINNIDLDRFLNDIRYVDPYKFYNQLENLNVGDIQSEISGVLKQNSPLMSSCKSLFDYCDVNDIFNVCPREDIMSPPSQRASTSTLIPPSTQNDIAEGPKCNAVENEATIEVDILQKAYQHINSASFELPEGTRAQEPYMEMIAKSIMESSVQRLLLSHIYAFIQREHPDFTSSKRAWKNSVRHNLSVNDCFLKAGQAPSGRGYYWKIHPACMRNFRHGNFNRRDAMKEVMKYNRRRIPSQESAHVPVEQNIGMNHNSNTTYQHHPVPMTNMTCRGNYVAHQTQKPSQQSNQLHQYISTNNPIQQCTVSSQQYYQHPHHQLQMQPAACHYIQHPYNNSCGNTSAASDIMTDHIHPYSSYFG